MPFLYHITINYCFHSPRKQSLECGILESLCWSVGWAVKHILFQVSGANYMYFHISYDTWLKLHTCNLHFILLMCKIHLFNKKDHNIQELSALELCVQVVVRVLLNQVAFCDKALVEACNLCFVHQVLHINIVVRSTVYLNLL